MEPADATASYLPRGDPDPNGDMILVVGPEDVVKQIRVATKVLSLASPVFAVMFGPQWAEGQALSFTNPSNVRLPNDDPDAMQCMLSVLHHRRDLTQKLPLPVFKKVALLCDKYDCSSALSPWAQDPLRELHSQYGHQYEALWLSYVFGSAHTFWKATRSLMHNQVRIDIVMLEQSSDDVSGLNLLPDHLLRKRCFDCEDKVKATCLTYSQNRLKRADFTSSRGFSANWKRR